jgi:hypothetical protein
LTSPHAIDLLLPSHLHPSLAAPYITYTRFAVPPIEHSWKTAEESFKYVEVGDNDDNDDNDDEWYAGNYRDAYDRFT